VSDLYSSTHRRSSGIIHGGIDKALPAACRKIDRPSAALVRDLKDRGLLDTTFVHWGGDMGRLPVIQNEGNVGRDHSTHGFSSWFAGGGIRSGFVYGETDEFGHKAVKDIVTHSDFHATVMHLFGLNANEVTFTRPTGPGSILDGQTGRIVHEILTRPVA